MDEANPGALHYQVPQAAPPSVSSGTQGEKLFHAVLEWAREDEAGRKVELHRLLPLARFPMMAKPAVLMTREPLVAVKRWLTQLVRPGPGVSGRGCRSRGWVPLPDARNDCAVYPPLRQGVLRTIVYGGVCLCNT